jgi:subtilisin family serine protease
VKKFFLLLLTILSLNLTASAIEPYQEWHQGQWLLWWDDSAYSREDYQWYIYNSGQPSKLYKYNSYVSEDWGGLYQTEIGQLLTEYTNSAKRIIVGLVDSGCFTNHIDLSGMIIKAINYSVGQDPNDVSDPTGHGTALAGVLSAKINGEGIRGIACSPIILAKTRLAARSNADINEVAVAITWLVDNGARVIVLPWGCKYYNENLRQACLYAASHDIVIVCSLPNEIGNLGDAACLVDYPTSFGLANILSVYNIDRNGGLYHSIYSSSAIGSPGRVIVTLAPNNWFTYTSGTSIASGVAGGVAALLRAIAPNAPAAEVVSAMRVNYNLKAYQAAKALLLLYPQTNSAPVRYNPPVGVLPPRRF